MTGQTRRKPSVPTPTPQRTAATDASGAQGLSYPSRAKTRIAIATEEAAIVEAIAEQEAVTQAIRFLVVPP